MEKSFVYPEVSLLITHYDRSLSLERLLTTFSDLQCSFGEIVVSDDGSKEVHIAKLIELQKQFHFKLITTPTNKGLGNNINKGQDAVTKPYTLYVQEDFEPTNIFPEHFNDALHFMEEDSSLDIARFYAYFAYPTMKPFGKGFMEMVFSFWDFNHLKFYYYSDHPHLRRSTFFQKFGRYPEGIKGDLTEFSMALSFIKNKGRGIFFKEFTTLFYQKNSAAEPSKMERANWRESKNPAIRLVRALYLPVRWLKNTKELFFFKN